MIRLLNAWLCVGVVKCADFMNCDHRDEFLKDGLEKGQSLVVLKRSGKMESTIKTLAISEIQTQILTFGATQMS